jgi:hypothetical protein
MLHILNRHVKLSPCSLIHDISYATKMFVEVQIMCNEICKYQKIVSQTTVEFKEVCIKAIINVTV